jgi:branched-chain amino acid transport system permease protein
LIVAGFAATFIVRLLTGVSIRETFRRLLPLICIYLISIPAFLIASAVSRHLTLGSWFAALFVMAFTVAVCGSLGYLIERLAYRPLRDRPRINSLITAIGISLLLEYGGQNNRAFGPTPQAYPDNLIPLIGGAPIIWHGIVVAKVDILVLVLTIGIMLGLTWLVLKTRTGLGLRAASYRFDTAALMGVNIDSVVSFTFVLGSCLAAIAGILWGVKYSSTNPLMGLMPGIKAFVAAVFGGIGNIAGAVLGAIVLGLVEVMVVGYLPGGSQYRDGVAFVILIAILLVKPSGLLGKNVVEKV